MKPNRNYLKNILKRSTNKKLEEYPPSLLTWFVGLCQSLEFVFGLQGIEVILAYQELEERTAGQEGEKAHYLDQSQHCFGNRLRHHAS